jgi:hypothetical protein
VNTKHFAAHLRAWLLGALALGASSSPALASGGAIDPVVYECWKAGSGKRPLLLVTLAEQPSSEMRGDASVYAKADGGKHGNEMTSMQHCYEAKRIQAEPSLGVVADPELLIVCGNAEPKNGAKAHADNKRMLPNNNGYRAIVWKSAPGILGRVEKIDGSQITNIYGDLACETK